MYGIDGLRHPYIPSTTVLGDMPPAPKVLSHCARVATLSGEKKRYAVCGG